MSTDVAPGWYPDPQTEGQIRYWDGNAWTEHVQPASQAGEPVAQAGAGAEYDAGSLEGVPAHGRQRIEQLKSGKLFTSDLSVNEFLLIKEAGFEPLGLVMGTS